MRLFDYRDSGNGYKARLLLANLGRDYEYVPVDILKGESRTPEFLARNPNGRIPTLELEDGTHVWESNAILWFLAEGTPFLPATALARARTLQWMFFEQYSHEPYVATPRFIVRHLPKNHPRQCEVAGRVEKGHAALGVMEQHLVRHPFFVDDRYGLADIALFAYTHVAPDGGLDLAPYPAVRQWLERVTQQPGYVAMLP